MKELNVEDRRDKRVKIPWKDLMYKGKDGKDYLTFEALKAANDAFFVSLKSPDRKLVAPIIDSPRFPKIFPTIRK